MISSHRTPILIRKALFGAAALLAVTGFMARGGETQSDWTPGKYMSQAVARVVAGAQEISKASDYGYDGGTCVLGAFLKQDAVITFRRPMNKGESYCVIGGGDEDVKDLDLELVDPNNTKVAEDKDDDATPVVVYTARTSGLHTIRLHLAGAPEASFCSMAILKKEGFDVPIGNLGTAVGGTIAMCQRVDKTAGGARFHEQANQWCFYGTILRKGEQSGITGMDLEARKHVLLATGDDSAKDLDIYLLDNAGKVLVADEDDDPTPVVQYTTGKHPSYGMRLKCVESTGPTLIVSAVLDI